ncbi:TIGR03986 family CRISPR-associated RAMP protein [Actinobacteria bacterium YIM 96077]|uniref:TIGR03986 family CRISPR-associated RAMP protein n=1 Tax=Phytoactinopolyspora halophila TaxID=1981511 RepID=A0A329QCD0_9ACTN|nr:TIGR03986 family CRISPR-associated RAMP protein [Actinobacteria bacterium YIM 96077]RAW10040.1 TIGR03986 family CRISPR-associated RAMP protein [Phytoactinopolyspora halophila]
MSNEKDTSTGTRTAPYRFIPLDDHVEPIEDGETQPWRRHDEYLPGHLHGRIAVTFRTLTPLFVGSATDKPENASRSNTDDTCDVDKNARTGTEAGTANSDQPQMSAHRPDGRPIIPGSSWRGAIRAVHQILTASAMRGVREDCRDGRVIVEPKRESAQHYRQRMTDGKGKDAKPRARGGILKQKGDRWVVQPGKIHRIMWPTLAGALGMEDRGEKEAPDPAELRDRCAKPELLDALWYARVEPDLDRRSRSVIKELIRPVDDGDRPDGDQVIEVRLALVGTSPSTENKRKTTQRLGYAVQPRGSREIEVTNRVEQVNEQLDRIADSAFYERNYGSGVHLRDGEVVFYTEKGDQVVTLGRTPYHRIPHTVTPWELLSPEHRETVLDRTRAIFGTVDTKDDNKGFLGPIASRLRFTDLVSSWDPDVLQSPWETPKKVALLQPHDTHGEHYLAAGSYFGPPEQAELAGYKIYPHQCKLAWDDGTNDTSRDEDAAHLSYIQPVKKGLRFSGYLEFWNLTQKELDLLLLALTLDQPEIGDNGEGRSDAEDRATGPDGGPVRAHKFGGAQSLGLGSVALDECRVEFFDPGQFYRGWQATPFVPAPGYVREHVEAARECLGAECKAVRSERLRNVRQAFSWAKRPFDDDALKVMPPDSNGWTSEERLPRFGSDQAKEARGQPPSRRDDGGGNRRRSGRQR